MIFLRMSKVSFVRFSFWNFLDSVMLCPSPSSSLALRGPLPVRWLSSPEGGWGGFPYSSS